MGRFGQPTYTGSRDFLATLVDIGFS